MRAFEALLRLTRAALFGGVPQTSDGLFDGLDWQDTLSLASRCAVTAIAAPALEKLPPNNMPPDSVYLSWCLSAQRCRDEYATRHRTLSSLHRLLADGGIGPVLLLKGETLADLYPDPAARASSDIDIMPLERFNESNMLFEKAGCDIDYSNSKHTVFTFEGIEIENHTPVPHLNYHHCDYRTEVLVQQACETGRLIQRDDGYLELDPMTQIIYTLNHFALHIYMNELVTLRMAADLELLLRRHPEVLSHWDKELRYTGLTKFSRIVLRMLDILFGEDRAPFSVSDKATERAAQAIIDMFVLDGGSKLKRLVYRFLWLPVTSVEFFGYLYEKTLRHLIPARKNKY